MTMTDQRGRYLMTDRELRALLNLLMCDDPSSVSADEDAALRELANRESTSRGFADWIDAYHRMGAKT
jgi:hypothetical protein